MGPTKKVTFRRERHEEVSWKDLSRGTLLEEEVARVKALKRDVPGMFGGHHGAQRGKGGVAGSEIRKVRGRGWAAGWAGLFQ